MHPFGMEDAFSIPTRNQRPHTMTSKPEKQSWVMREFCNIVRSYVWAKQDKSRFTDEENVKG